MKSKLHNAISKLNNISGFAIISAITLVLISFIIIAEQRLDAEEILITNTTSNSVSLVWKSTQPYAPEVAIQKSGSTWTIFPSLAHETKIDDREYYLSRSTSFLNKNLADLITPSYRGEARYTHHVTFNNLEPETEYQFALAGFITARMLPVVGKTSLATISPPEPDPAYGIVERHIPGDSVVVTQLTDRIISTPVSSNGSYSFNFAEKSTNEITLSVLSGNSPRFRTQISGDSYKPLATINLYGQSSLISSKPFLEKLVKEAAAVQLTQITFDPENVARPLDETNTYDVAEQYALEANFEIGPPDLSDSNLDVAISPDFRAILGDSASADPNDPLAEEVTIFSAGQIARPDAFIPIEEDGRYAFFTQSRRIARYDVAVNKAGETIELRMFFDDNANGIKDIGEEYVENYTSIRFEKEASVEVYDLSPGWNAINLPMFDTREVDAIDTAGKLLEYWNNQGAKIKHIAPFINNDFKFITKRESGIIYQGDEPLIPGTGMFVFNAGAAERVTFSGNRYAESKIIPLVQGWNLVGVISPDREYSAISFLDALGEERILANIVSNFTSGSYTSVIREDGTIFGNDYTLNDKTAYFINVSSGGQNFLPYQAPQPEPEPQPTNPIPAPNPVVPPVNPPVAVPSPNPQNPGTGTVMPVEPLPTSCNQVANLQCKKVGINYAVVPGVSANFYDRARNLNMGYALFLVDNFAQQGAVVTAFNELLNRGITPILRICVNRANCPFTDPNQYADFLKQISAQLGGREFYAIAGPNEPITEVWLGGIEGDPESVARTVTPYMNAVIDAMAGTPQVKLLSPAFNLTHPNLLDEINYMKQFGAKFDSLAGISGNSYNTPNGTTRYFVDRLKEVGLYRNLHITETGMYDSSRNPALRGGGIPEGQSILGMRTELDAMKTDPNVRSLLIFNGFGTNPDPAFVYNVISDQQYHTLLGSACIEYAKLC